MMLKFGTRIDSRLLAAAAVAVLSFGVLAEPVRTPHVEAELVSRDGHFVPGKPIETALRLKIKPHWHTYWRNPGDSGLPTKLDWRLPDGFRAGSIDWPYPKRLPLGPLMNFGYEGEVLHLVKIETPHDWPAGKKAEFRAKAEWLVCSDVCIPESAELSLTLPASLDTPKRTLFDAAFADANAALPAAGPVASVQAISGKLRVAVETRASGSGILFFPYAEGLIGNAGTQTIDLSGSGTVVTATLAEPPVELPKDIRGILVAEQGWPQFGGKKAIEVSASLGGPMPAANTGSGNAENLGLAAAILLGLAGGLLLNLMPCVFPVLGIKLMQFANHAHGDRRELRNQGWAYLGGVMVSFWALSLLLLALKSAGHAVGWGFQLQSPAFVAFLCILFLLLALNLLGCFEWGSSLQQMAGQHDTRASGTRAAFMTGVLATVVATPCTAPFMGAALGFTLSQPVGSAMLVFSAIGLGMAVPVLLLCLRPGWIARLPKPGVWMEVFKQAMAFPLLATMVWLLWVLGSQVDNDGVAHALAGLVIIALSAWVYGRLQSARPLAAATVALPIVAVGIYVAWPVNSETPTAKGAQTSTTDAWQPYSENEVARLRAAEVPVFVDFTASWCITCQFNKKTTLQDQKVQARFKAMDVRLLRADWSRQDPEITKALASFGRNGVPLYVYYPKNAAPKVLPEILTPDAVLEALSGS
jgi:thiol:disulfide interchange protein DsbD